MGRGLPKNVFLGEIKGAIDGPAVHWQWLTELAFK
jgi:hypothetical protein